MVFSQLPYWIQLGAFALAFNAGMLNVLSLLTLLHQSISHMTGNISLFTIAWWQGDYSKMLFLFLIVVCFVLGAFYSGFILGDGQVKWGRRYGLPLTLVSLFTFLCWLFLPYFPRYALLWVAAAMGMQNAMVSHYQGTIIRSTHLTGILTDLGLTIGYFFHGIKSNPRRIILHLLIISGFTVGGVIATILFHFFNIHAFLIPTIWIAILSIIYWVLYFYKRKYNR